MSARKTPLEMVHLVDFGLSVAARNLKSVVCSIQCDLCAIIGLEEADVARNASERRIYTSTNRRSGRRITGHIIRNNPPLHCKSIKPCPDPTRSYLFNRKSKNTMDGYSDKTRKRLKFRIDAPIVKDVIGGISFTLVG